MKLQDNQETNMDNVLEKVLADKAAQRLSGEEIQEEPTANEQTDETGIPAAETTDTPATEEPAAEDIPAPETQPPVEPGDVAVEASMRAAAQLQAAQAKIAELENMLSQSHEAAQQQSDAAETQIEQAIIEPPRINVAELVYLSEEEAAQKERDYAQQMLDYTLQHIDGKIKPIVDNFQNTNRAAEEEKALAELRTHSPDIDQYIPDMQVFLGSNNAIAQALSTMPPKERYSVMYMMSKGGEAINPKPRTAEQIAEEAANNPDVMRILESKRAEAANKNANIPPMSAASGMSRAPVNLPKKPETIEEAGIIARKRFFGKK